MRMLFIFGLLISIQPVVFNQEVRFVDIEGWEKEGAVATYTPDNLWDYINGAADFYLSCGFEELYLQNYTSGSAYLTIELYRHSDSDHAFGIYSNERNNKAEFVDIGAEGYFDSKVLNFLQGNYYVKLQLAGEVDQSDELLKMVATGVSNQLMGDKEMPKALKLFPRMDQVEKTATFTADGFLGYSFFTTIYKVDYAIDGHNLQLFLCLERGGEQADELIKTYQRTLGIEQSGMPEDKILMIEDPFNDRIFFRIIDNRLWGIRGDELPLEVLEKAFSQISND